MTERDDEDDVTIWAGRLRAWPAAEPVPDAASEDEIDDATALRARRETPAVPEAPDATALRAARRNTPPAKAPPPPADPAVGGRRVARVPDAASREIYRPRYAPPEIVERTPPPPRERQHPVTAEPDALAAARARRRRRQWVITAVVGAAVAVLVAAAATLVLALG